MKICTDVKNVLTGGADIHCKTQKQNIQKSYVQKIKMKTITMLLKNTMER